MYVATSFYTGDNIEASLRGTLPSGYTNTAGGGDVDVLLIVYPPKGFPPNRKRLLQASPSKTIAQLVFTPYRRTTLGGEGGWGPLLAKAWRGSSTRTGNTFPPIQAPRARVVDSAPLKQ